MKPHTDIQGATASFPPIHEDTGGHLRPGILAAANASRFEAQNANQELTSYGVGYFEENDLLALLRAIIPSVPAPMRFSFRKGVNDEHFISETDDIRAIGADFKRVEFGGEEVESRLHNKGLITVIDHDEEGDTERLRQQRTRMLINRVLRNDLRRAIALLEAAATNQARTWNPAADPLLNPYAHLRSDIQLSQDAVGMYPTRQVWGRTAWNALQDLVEAHDGAIGSTSVTMENVADKLGLNRLVGVDPVYTTASGKSKILGLAIYTYLAMEDADRDDPSAIKRFVHEDIGDGVRVYTEEKTKFTVITVEHYSRLVSTSPIGVRKTTVSTS